MMKKILSVCMFFVMCAGLLAGCAGPAPVAAEPTVGVPDMTEAPTEKPAAAAPENEAQEPEGTLGDITDHLWEISENATVDEALTLEKRNLKLLQAFQPYLDEDGFRAYNKLATAMKKDKTQEAIDAAVAARNEIVQTASLADNVWFLWDADKMPMKDGETFTEEELDASQMDATGFIPFVMKYLLDDPAAAKGNIVAVSGGAMKVRSNGAEGYPAAKVFNDLGYNYFLLQRRVEPYSNEDIFMDYQRAIRLVRYHAELENYGHPDMIAGLGWSGGGFTIMGAVNYLYGDVTPAIFDTDYVADDIDAVSSDLDVVMPIYGGSLIDNCQNANLPAFFIVHGAADDTVDPQSSINLYERVKDIVPAQLTMIEGAGHGFGVGVAPATGQAPGTDQWPMAADAFMQQNYGHSGH